MKDLESAAYAIRRMESGDDYTRQQDIRANGQKDRKVGAYGLLESVWDGLAVSLGYTGARWQDPKAQDVIAKEKLSRDYKALGSWDLAVVSFRYGRAIADHFKRTGVLEPKDMENAGYKGVGKYLRDTRRGVSDPERRIEGSLPTPPDGKPVRTQPPPQRKKSEDIVRSRIIGMRDQQRKRGATPDGSDSEVQQNGNQGLPDITE
jgi:hypothetical protein